MRTTIFFAALALATVLSGPVSATTMVRLSASELRHISDLAAQATVLSISVEHMPGRQTLQTVTSLRLDRVLLGEEIENDVVTVREWGGELDGEVTTLPSSPVYSPGERVLVFLERDPKDVGYRTVGLNQGKWTLVEEPDTGRDVLVRLPLERPVPRFVERMVRLPAVREYADDLWGTLAVEQERGYVPPYTPIPGLPLQKDEAFFQGSLQWGHPERPGHRLRLEKRRQWEVSAAGGGR